jgi:putative nucleotidyltransferase with HDIG domain
MPSSAVREAQRRPQAELAGPVALLITLAAMAASAAIVLTLPDLADELSAHPARVAAFLALALALQFFSFEVYGRGSISVSGVGLLAAGFSLGAGPAMVIAFLAALVQWFRRRGLLHRAIFDAANFSLSTGAGAATYHALSGGDPTAVVQLGAAVLSAVAFTSVNLGLICLAMGLSEQISPLAVWRERFRWMTANYLAFGPLAAAAMIAYEKLGPFGLLSFALPPALMIFSIRQYLERTRAGVEEVRRANEDLKLANAQLEARNDDLRELFQFAGGLAARAHDRASLVAYAEETLSRLTGGRARITEPEGGGITLLAGGNAVGSLRFDEGFRPRAERWDRLREVILPQLATAIESTELVARVRKTHLATIAALSRSMEAKDFYTGGHTERVATVAVALARRLGYTGADLDSIEIGALLHDIGKIGIPESILHKSGPLDDDEWAKMREHPLISEYILSGVDLPLPVRQIARSSHERIDGAGYPDGLSGPEIALPARIVFVADAFDALTSDRPYRPGRQVSEALEEVRAHTGTQFCPTVVQTLEQVYVEEPQALGSTVPLRAVEVA